MFAAMHNPDPDVINALLAAGADPNAHDRDGRTALMHAGGIVNSCVAPGKPGKGG